MAFSSSRTSTPLSVTLRVVKTSGVVVAKMWPWICRAAGSNRDTEKAVLKRDVNSGCVVVAVVGGATTDADPHIIRDLSRCGN